MSYKNQLHVQSLKTFCFIKKHSSSDLGSGEESVHCIGTRTFKGSSYGTKAKTELHTVSSTLN